MKPTLNLQSGFSIIEAIIALAIVMLILVLYQTSANTVTLTRESQNQEIALRVASVKLEELRAAGYGSLPASGSFSDPGLSSLPSGSGTLTVTDINDSTKAVTVTVAWDEPKSDAVRDISLTTAIADTGGL